MPTPFLIDGNQLIFFAFEQTSKYSAHRVYQLHLGSNAAGKELAFARFDGIPKDSSPIQPTVQRIIKFEENLRYVSTARQSDASPTWFWERIHVSGLFEFEADFPHVADGSATVTAHLFGVSHDSKIENDHDLDFLINDQKLAQIVWDGNRHFSAVLELPTNSLQNGANRIQLDNRPEGATFVDISELDAISFHYDSDPILVDDHIQFSTPAGKVELSGFTEHPYIIAFHGEDVGQLADTAASHRGSLIVDFPAASTVYAAGPEGLLTPKIIKQLPNTTLQTSVTQTDLIIITDEELANALQPFKVAREAQGVNVTVATVEAIYDQFGFGQPSPQAIQGYLKNALEHWPKPAPQYLLLVGGTTYDFKNHLDGERKNRVPSLLIDVFHSGETVSDIRLADVDGDNWADFSVGRWPVNSPSELEGVIQRTLAYERDTPGDHILATADHSEAQFSSTSDRLLQLTGLEAQDPKRAYNDSPESLTEAWNKGELVDYICRAWLP